MNIYGMQKTTLLDYPGHLAATLFTGGCNMRCPFCHNKDLIPMEPPSDERLSLETLFSFLKRRQGVLEGVCITGGEPTLQPDLIPFIQRIKELDYKVKLDTNGMRPDIIKTLVENQWIDYIAVDIKSSKQKYEIAAGVDGLPINRIEETVDYLMKGDFPYEFRTTVVKQLHSPQDIKAIARWLAGCTRYFLQAFKDSENVLMPGLSSYSKEEMEELLKIAKVYIPSASLRGID